MSLIKSAASVIVSFLSLAFQSPVLSTPAGLVAVKDRAALSGVATPVRPLIVMVGRRRFASVVPQVLSKDTVELIDIVIVLS